MARKYRTSEPDVDEPTDEEVAALEAATPAGVWEREVGTVVDRPLPEYEIRPDGSIAYFRHGVEVAREIGS